MRTKPLIAAIVIFSATASESALTFMPIVGARGASALSDDGHSVTGGTGTGVYRWTDTTGLQVLAPPTPPPLNFIARDISGDGSTIVGDDGFIWTEAGGSEHISAPGYTELQAFGSSQDGAVIVGRAASPTVPENTPFVRNATGAVTTLAIPDGQRSAYARAVSADGNVIAGNMDTTITSGNQSSNVTTGFLWTQDSGYSSLGDLPGGPVNSEVFAISADGITVVGSSHATSARMAFRWTSETGIQSLGQIPGGYPFSEAYDVSGDGSVIVGNGSFPSGSGISAFVWDQTNGMQRVASVLEDGGVDLTGWHLYRASGVSSDGSTIVGSGINPEGNYQGWIASGFTFPEVPVQGIPEPSRAILSLVALGAVATRRRR